MAGNTIGGSGNSSFGGQLATGSIPDFNGEYVLAVGDGSFDNPLGCLVEIQLVDHEVADEDGPGTIPENIHGSIGFDGGDAAQEWVL